jgi:DNA-binding FadR family transcriptional regulator
MTEITGRPAYLQVADQLREKITTGEWTPGKQLPSTRQLMHDFGVSSTVVKNAIHQLRATGHVVGQQGKGVFARLPDETWVAALISAGLKLAELVAASAAAERDDALSAWEKALNAVPTSTSGSAHHGPGVADHLVK